MSSAIQKWNEQVEAHHAQSIKAQEELALERSTWSTGDFWKPFADYFKADPRRTDDDLLNLLLKMVNAEDTVLDVGGGAGRLALPIALHSKRVTVVEPSESMVNNLRQVASENGIENVSVVQETWEEAKTEPQNIVLCAHVVYGVSDIEPFLRKLDSHAKEKVIILAFVSSPISRMSPFWEPVHGEKRIDLPGLVELVPVLYEMDIYPDVEMIRSTEARTFDSYDAALEQLQMRLYVQPGSEKDSRLHAAMKDILEETPNGLIVKGAKTGDLGVISWKPSRE